MRADDAALPALDAEAWIPDRHFHRDIALFILRRAAGERAVRRHEAHGNQIAAPGHDFRRHLAHEGRRVRPHDGRQRGAVQGGGNRDLMQGVHGRVDGGEIELHHRLALVLICLLDEALDLGDGDVRRQDMREMEEAGLQNRVESRTESDAQGDCRCVDDEEAQLLVDDLLLHRSGQLRPDFFRPIGAVQKEGRARARRSQNVALEQEAELVAGDKTGVADQIGRGDRLGAEPQMRRRLGAGLVQIIIKIGLRILVRPFAQDFNAALVGAHGAIGAQTKEQAAHCAFLLDVQHGVVIQTRPADVIDNAQRKAVLRSRAFSIRQTRPSPCPGGNPWRTGHSVRRSPEA